MSQSAIRKCILLFLFFSTCASAFNQVIKGTVFDKETNNAISFAAIYFGGTFVGTTSDQDGRFELDISKNTSMPLTISAIGYYSFSLTDLSSVEPYLVYLTPKVYEINEAAVSAKSLARERRMNLKLFKNAFIGTSFNARSCDITNENDITFNYGSDSDTLKAFSKKPIQIDNRSLGYKITFYLDKFEYCRQNGTIVFTGDIIFNKDLTTVEAHKRSYPRKRKYAYFGSRMHFFRALWANDLKSNKFLITNSEKTVLKYKNIVVQGDSSMIFLTYSEYLNIGYYKRLSKINFLKEQVFFDQDGFFDPAGISWKGEMGKKRIADWLPYEYSVGY
ncbi:MAG: carboxypeptidase-like regulatory domain-containing protein [Bacteroidales bacterium]|nr:carboxypeptidase-like regulatory domain-containing protein [Bacteroidales bacterium]